MKGGYKSALDPRGASGYRENPNAIHALYDFESKLGLPEVKNYPPMPPVKPAKEEPRFKSRGYKNPGSMMEYLQDGLNHFASDPEISKLSNEEIVEKYSKKEGRDPYAMKYYFGLVELEKPKPPERVVVDESLSASLGLKFDSDKPDWSLLPLHLLRGIVRVLGYGAKKYARNNWQHVPDAKNRYTAALLRHLAAWQGGERVDPETQLSHLHHIGCCLLFLIWFEEKECENTSR
jgi:hypothetical protein